METELKLHSLRRSVLRTLAYYDIFSYPLTANEIYYNLGENHISIKDVENVLQKLSDENIVYRKEHFYQLNNNEELVKRRYKGNELAEKRLQTAQKVSSLISRFPFIRGIMLSGSISKGYMEEDSDIDYFVVTYPDRVWITRLVLMMFKKIFLFNSKKNFCINYFVDYENLEIHEKNVFTATEIMTLMPTFGKDCYEKFYEQNLWIKNFFPNFPKRDTSGILNRKNGLVKTSLEKILSKKFGNKLDDFSMALFGKFYKVKYKNYDEEEFKLAFKSSKKESKHHPKFFQKRVLAEFESKLKLVEDKLNVSDCSE